MQDRGGELEDREIIEKVLNGDTDAFEILLERHRDHVFRIVGRRVPAEDVPEIAHDVFVKAYTSLGSFRGEGPFEGWLSGIAVRTCHDYWRSRYRSKEDAFSSLSERHEQWLEDTLHGESSDSWEASQSRMFAREILMTALEKLSAKDRAVIELVHLEERPVREAAEMLGWTKANVKVRAFRARKKLRSIIEELSGIKGGAEGDRLS